MDANALAFPGNRARRGALAALALTLASAAAFAPMAHGQVATAAGAGDTISSEQADARDPASGRLLYREQHWLRRDATGALRQRLVLYACPDGTPFARKRMDYRGAPLAPGFELEDARSGYREGLRRLPAPRLFVRASARAAEHSAPLQAGSVVADAGFDEFVRAHWTTLAAGRAASMDFAVPARLRSYRFSLARTGQARIAGEDAMLLRLRLDGWLAWLAPRMDLAYGLRSRRLLRFEGVSNLPDPAGGKNWLARIDFGPPPRLASEADWARAQAAALSACAGTDTGSGRPDIGGPSLSN